MSIKDRIPTLHMALEHEYEQSVASSGSNITKKVLKTLIAIVVTLSLGIAILVGIGEIIVSFAPTKYEMHKDFVIEEKYLDIFAYLEVKSNNQSYGARLKWAPDETQDYIPKLSFLYKQIVKVSSN